MVDLNTIEEFCEALGKYDIEWQVTEDGLRCYDLKESPGYSFPFCPITALCYVTTGQHYSPSEVAGAAARIIPSGSDLYEARQDIVDVADNYEEYATDTVLHAAVQELVEALQKHLKITEKGGPNENV